MAAQRADYTIASTPTPTVGPLTSTVVVGGVKATHLEVSAQTENRVNVGIRRGAVGVALIGDLDDLVQFALKLTGRLMAIKAAQAPQVGRCTCDTGTGLGCPQHDPRYEKEPF